MYLLEIIGAGNGDRTRDPRLGKPMLYQLSYARLLFFIKNTKKQVTLSSLFLWFISVVQAIERYLSPLVFFGFIGFFGLTQ